MFTLNWTDSSLKTAFTIADSVLDTTHSSLTLTGNSAVNWGLPLQQNIMHLLENFASRGSEPLHPTTGQSWYNSTTNRLNIRLDAADVMHGSVWWSELANRRIDSTTQPVNTTATPNFLGDLWFDTNGTLNTGLFVFVNPDTWLEIAPVISPHFAGIPTTPTAAAHVNTTQVASTAFVIQELANSPVLAGIPVTPTAAVTTNTTQVASTAFVQSQFPAGTRMAFHQATAPTGWLRDATLNDAALRVVSTGGGTSGGATGFAAASYNPIIALAGTVDPHTLTIAEMPSHSHTMGLDTYNNSPSGFGSNIPMLATIGTPQSGFTGGGGAHSHTLSGFGATTSFALGLKYVDVLIAAKQ